MSPTDPVSSAAANEESPLELELILAPERAGERIDLAIGKSTPRLSRTYAGQLLRDGAILVNGRAVKPSYKVVGGERIQIELPEPEAIEARAEDIPLDVIHEDADIIVINKPAGMVTHPSAGHASGSLVNALLFRCKDLSAIGGSLRPGIVHRLDKDTTGIIVAAKNDVAHRALAEQFAERKTTKEYLAICHGNPLHAVFDCDGRIGRHPQRRTEMAVLKRPGEGREAFTSFEIQERFAKRKMFLVRALPKTGRTHQIRVHLAKSGYPIIADPLYGKEVGFADLELWRHALHACRLGFNHPRTGVRVTYEAPLAKDMQFALAKLRG